MMFLKKFEMICDWLIRNFVYNREQLVVYILFFYLKLWNLWSSVMWIIYVIIYLISHLGNDFIVKITLAKHKIFDLIPAIQPNNELLRIEKV